jgi:medium-chain acyl-[acyl-carrier-protein] hydrolase
MKLFLLGHAGGSPTLYVSRFPALARRLDLVPLDLPGHGRRIDEPLLESVPAMVTDLRKQLQPFLANGPEPYALFGHSMGGLLAFALQLDLAAERRYSPADRLFVSSTCFPGHHHIPPDLPALSDQQLWRRSASYFSGMSAEVAASEELMALFAPILRADLRAVLSWSPPHLEATQVPLTVMGGEADIVNREDLEFWRGYTTGEFSLRVLPGNHFHLLENPRPVEEILLSSLAAVTGPVGVAVTQGNRFQ